ncbi:MAG: hypothetical protein ABGZ17_03370, partial [Planctomycetaceae bacterium]
MSKLRNERGSSPARAPAFPRSHVAVIGGGPIGLETALAAVNSGHTVRVYERSCVGGNIDCWGHVTLFTPFGINASSAGQAALNSQNIRLPGAHELLTGHEFRNRYLLPLSRMEPLQGCIHQGCEVVTVGRPHLWKGDDIASTKRSDDGFQLLIREHVKQSTREFFAFADYVFDCSGTYTHHNWMGAGGIPAIGERAILSEHDYRIPDVLGQDRGRFANRSTLIAGSGFSAATAAVAIHELSLQFPQSRAVWLTRSRRHPPIASIENDTLPERSRLARQANELAVSDSTACRWLPDSCVHQLHRKNNGQIEVQLSSGDAPTHIEVVDQVIVQTGFRPDRTLYEELHVHECYASQGPMKLAATRMATQSPDCMAQPASEADALLNPEPHLFI